MDTRDHSVDHSRLSPSNASPPDFDFNIQCRFFKSSFARSLSLNNASCNNSSNHCKSLDYDIRATNNNKSNKLSCFKRDLIVPSLPQIRSSQAGSVAKQNEANITSTEQKHVFAASAAASVAAVRDEKPPALLARRPQSLYNFALSPNVTVNECQLNGEQNFQQNVRTQLRQDCKQASKSSNNNSTKLVYGNTEDNNKNNSGCNRKSHIEQPTLIQEKIHQLAASSCQNLNICNNNNNNYDVRRNISNNNSNNKNIVWLQHKNIEQTGSVYNYGRLNRDANDDQLNSNCHGETNSSTVSNEYSEHFHNSHQLLHAVPPTNIHTSQQQQQQNQQQYHLHQQQKPQQLQQKQHQLSSYEILNENVTNVEAVILQNKVDTLQWQLKQVETSCDMYRAVMEEVARFLERYQSQKQLQQQQLKQQQQTLATQKPHTNSSNKLEQMPRSKSLFQVYFAGGHEKAKCETNNKASKSLKSATDSHLRTCSSTNLIDLKYQPLNASCSSKSRDDHIYEIGLTPSPSYNALKDLTWRRFPKKSDLRTNIAKDDAEEKLNQEAFRLLRTIHNLLNTSQHQPDLINHRHSLDPAAASQISHLPKAMSTTSISTLPAPTMLNSNSNTGSLAPDPTITSTNITTGNNAASNNLAPEMLFLRSANMRDSRLSLRSSTDSSVHSTSSAASSASSKVETDEDPSTPFNSSPNVQTHKQHHHLAGSSTEDESGFSSISSFPDIAMPLNSTVLSTGNTSSKNLLMEKELNDNAKALSQDLPAADNHNSTLNANIVGLPLPSNASPDTAHRWDAPSKTYHNASNIFQRFSALTNDDSTTVLWV